MHKMFKTENNKNQYSSKIESKGCWERVEARVKKVFRILQQGRIGWKSLDYTRKTDSQLQSDLRLVWKC